MSKAYDRMVAARREFNVAWAAWVLDINTRTNEITQEMDGTISTLEQFALLQRSRSVVDIRHVCELE